MKKFEIISNISKKIGIVLFLIFLMSPTPNAFAQNSNIGFVSQSIWYSKEKLEEGDKVKIYTFIFNPDSREFSGTVLFFDNTTLLGKKNFVIPPKGAEDVSIDWAVNAGKHTIFGKIENAKFSTSNGGYEEVYLSKNETDKSSVSVSKKIIQNLPAKEQNGEAVSSPGIVSFTDIKNTIQEKTPEFVSKTISIASGSLEKIREDINTATESKKEEIKSEIAKLKENFASENGKTEAKDKILKPFKHAELFFVSLFSSITNNKILFYGLIAITIFAVLRSIFNRIL